MNADEPESKNDLKSLPMPEVEKQRGSQWVTPKGRR
jgi:hypothetical protein